MSERPLIALHEAVAGYHEPVVGPISFSLEAGTVLGIAGPNGVGKSTLLKTLMGTARLFAGRIEKRPGLRIAHHRQQPRRGAELPLNGHDLLRIAGADSRSLPDELAPLLRQRLDRLSGGQFQLLQTWACLGGPAQLILLDEPTNNLDPTAMAALGRLIRHDPGQRSVIVISHDAAFLEKVCDRVLALDTKGAAGAADIGELSGSL